MPERLDTLVPTMLKADKKAPKLRASAAACRALIPWVSNAAERLLSDTDPEELAVKVAARQSPNFQNSFFVALLMRRGPHLDEGHFHPPSSP